nr:polymorphic toxin-type HINT domain-containing protein [Saccharothrix mutabilis subsp. capreolus]
MAGAAAAGAVGEVPQQEWGSAAGRSHEATSEQTRAEDKPGTVHDSPPAPGGLPADEPYPDPELGRDGPAQETVVEVGGDGSVVPAEGGDGARRELVNRRSADTQEFVNPDGTRTRRVFQGRKFFSRNGLWFPIDSTLVAEDGAWRSRSDSVNKRFAESADAATVASLELAPGVSFGYGLAGAADVEARVEDAAVTYPDVRAGVDLELESTPNGIKETLVLDSADAPTEWDFPLRLNGLTASLDAGAVVLKDGAGVVRAVVPPGFMEDSAIDPRSGEGARSRGVTYRLDGDVLHVSLDKAWLSDPARVFPVKADPSVVSNNADGSTFVQSPWNADYSGDPTFSVGTYDGGTSKANGFLKFDSVSSALAGNYILDVNLWLYNVWSFSCEARWVGVHEVTSPWSLSGAKTWPGPSYGEALGVGSFASGYSANCNQSGTWHKIPLGTAGVGVVHRWTRGGTNNGLTVRASESDSYGWKKFASRNSANPPYLEITYNPYWATYEVGAMTTPVTSTSDGVMRVKVTNHGRDTWTPTNNYKLHYRVWNSNGTELGDVAWTSMPHDVPPGSSATVDATIRKLPPGAYTLHFDMDHYGTTKFSWTGVPGSAAVGMQIPNKAPVVTSMSPPSNYVSEALNPTLVLGGQDPDNHPGSGLSYLFKICDAGGDNLQNCTESTWSSSPAWTVPNGKLAWGKSYVWYGMVGDGAANSLWTEGAFLSTQVPQPAVTSRLGASSTAPGGGVDPAVGNYTTTATDAVVSAVGPPLSVVRSYNSLDPRRSSAFGAGWSTRWDTAITPETDGSGNLVVTYPEGAQARFGKRSDGSYAPPAGRFATLVSVAGGGWKLSTKGHVNYSFDASGRLTSITDDFGRVQTLGRDASGRLTTATDAVSGRSLTFTWTGAHVTRVTTGPDSNLSWDYTYDGDLLTKVCDPTGGCTTYEHADVLHYRSTVLDGNPSGYWRLHETSGTVAGNRAPIGGTEANGTYSNVILGAAAAMPGSDIGSARLNGTTSYIKLPDKAIGSRAMLTAELWFKTSSSAGGVLLGTSAQAEPNGAATGSGTPILYVGTDGKLYGHFWNGNVTGIVTPNAVNDGIWHHAVLTGTGDRQTLYLDGTAVGTQTGAIVHTEPLTHLGAGLVNSRAWPARPADNWGRFNGYLSDVAIYDRPLTALTVAEHWNARLLTKALSKVVLPGGRVASQVTYGRAPDRVGTHVDHNGGTWTVQQLTLGSKTSMSSAIVNPDGQSTTYNYNPSRGSRLNRTTLPNVGTTWYSYDTGGFLSETINPNNVNTTLVNDARGNVLSRSVGWNDGTNTRTTSYANYFLNAEDPLDPRNDRVTEARDGRSANSTDTTYLTTYAYTPSGDPAGTTLPGSNAASRRSTSTTYTTGTEAAIGGGTMPPGLKRTETNAGGGVTTYAYTSRGDLREITDPAGLKTLRTHDALGRTTEEKVVSATFPQGVATTFTYDGMSRLLTRTEPAVTNAVTGTAHQQRTTNTYNPDGTIASIKVDDAALNDPGRTTSYTYDTYGRVATLTDPTGAVTRTEYDTMGELTKRIDPVGTEFTYTYTIARHQLATTTVKGFTGDGGAPRDIVLESRAYDPGGQLASKTDAMGRTTAYEYRYTDKLYSDTLVGYRNPDTGATYDVNLHLYYYDGAGNLTGLETRGGDYYTSYTRDLAGRVIEARDSDNACPGKCGHTGHARSTSTTYDANDNATSIVVKSPSGARVAQTDHTYDALGRELTRAVHTGTSTLVTTTTRDELGLALTVTDPRGNTQSLGYDALGRITTTTGPTVPVEANGQAPVSASAVTKTGYNTFGEPVDRLDPLGNVTRTGFDAAGRPTSTTLPPYTPPGASEPITATTNATYDGAGRVTATTDALGNTTNFDYDQLGNRTRRTDPLLPGQTQRGVWTSTYDPLGELLSTTDPNGAQTSATYDMLGNKITSTIVERTPAPTRNLTTQLRYDELDNLASVTSPDGHKTQYVNDDKGNRVWTSNPLGQTSSALYDAAGRLVAGTDALGAKTTASYDLAGRLTAASDLSPTGTVLRTRTFGHDAAGNQTSLTDSLGNTTTRTYDAAGRLTTITRPVTGTTSITTSYGYDAAGNLTRATDGNGNPTIYTTNTWGLPESTIEPATAQNPDAADRTYTTTYDKAGQRTLLTKPGGVSIGYSYDPLGNLVKQTGAGTVATTPERTFGYDLAGRMTSAGGNTYTYDDRGNLVNATGPSGNSSSTYDNHNRLSTVSTATGTTSYGYDTTDRLTTATDPVTGVTATYTRDALGRTTTIGYGTGTSTRAYTYDPLGRPATDTITAPGGTATTSTTYTFDTEDHLTAKTTTGLAGAGTNTYTYDKAGRLTSWNNGSTTTDYGWDGNGNLTRDGTTTATYNQRNHLLSRGDTTYTYESRGVQASRTTGGTTTTLRFNAYDELTTDGATTNTYDPLGRLHTSGNRTLVYQGTGQTIISDGTDFYSHTPDGAPLGIKQGTATGLAVTDLHTDLVATTDPTTGTPTNSRTYTPFGTVQATTGTQPTLGYQHQYTDPTSGNVNMGARWYQPGTGTFTSRDTATLDPTDLLNANRHAYAAANPLGAIDPTGFNAGLLIPIADLIGTAVGGQAARGAAGAAVGRAAGAFGWSNFTTGAGGVAASGLGWIIPLPGDFETTYRRGIDASRFSRGTRPTRCMRWCADPDPGPTPPLPGPTPPGNSGHTETEDHYGGDLPGWFEERDDRAQRVLDNAMTPATPPGLTATIAAGIQAMIDALNNQARIELGIIDPGISAEPFRPEEADGQGGPGGPGVTIDRRKQDSECESDANGEYWNDGRECFYRTMSWKEFDRLNKKRGLSLQSNKTELFATRVKDYSAGYLHGKKGQGKYDVLVEFELAPGTTDKFYDPQLGRRGDIPGYTPQGWHEEYMTLRSISGVHPSLRDSVVHVKADGGVVSYGLTDGTINPYFNRNVLTARVIGTR